MAHPTERRIQLRILHISDLHEKGPREEDRPARVNVLAERFFEALDRFCGHGAIDLVFFTGDIAKSGKQDEYKKVTPWLERILDRIGASADRLFVIPGNHDVDRDQESTLRETFVAQASSADPRRLSTWMAKIEGGEPPLGFDAGWRERILTREGEFWRWLRDDMGRPDLCPASSAHGLLGYRSEFRLQGLEYPIQIIGIDTA